MTPELPLPAVTALTAPFWDGLADGELRFQRCGACGHAWLPAREECPRCLSDAAAWAVSTGRGRLISWVVYHSAPHPAFAERVPYNVAIVELAEGPRLITNVLAAQEDLAIEQSLVLCIEQEAGRHVARFRPS